MDIRGLHTNFFCGVIQRLANSSNISPATDLLASVVLNSTELFSLKLEDIKTKYLLVNGVRVSLGVVPRYSFYYWTDHPPQRTLH
jgi:hypothetical protein